MNAAAQDPIAAPCPCGKPGRSFAECHGAATPVSLVPAPLAAPAVTRKIDLACGQSPREGFEGVDLYAPGAQHKFDILKFPWPFADGSVAELHASHFVEHIPMIEVDGTGVQVPFGTGQDLFFAFFDEAYRVLAVGGTFTVIVPCGRSNRAFQDPTHRRFLVEPTFFYLWRDWRVANKLDHYNVKCNFVGNVDSTIPIEFNALHDEVKARKFNHEWNTVVDLVVKMIKQP